MPSKDISERPSTAIQRNERQAVKALAARLQLEASLPQEEGAGGTEEIIQAIQEKILTAETADDIFAAANASGANVENFIDRPIEIQGFTVLKSSEKYRNDNPLGVFLAISFVDMMSGEKYTVTASGRILVTMLSALRDKAMLPYPCAFISQTTSAGYTTHKLRQLTDVERAAVGAARKANA